MINLKMLFKMIKTFLILNTIMKLVVAEKPIRTPTLIKKSYSGKTDSRIVGVLLSKRTYRFLSLNISSRH